MSNLEIMKDIFLNAEIRIIDMEQEYQKFLDIFRNILNCSKDMIERNYPNHRNETLSDYLNGIIRSGYYDYRFHLDLLYEDGMDYEEPFRYIGDNRYICNSLKLVSDIEDIFPAKLIYLRKEDENNI
ncbi:hypothetical protein J6W34_09340 [bacterium]|nr:hypothetical protein [bacterium]